MIKSSQNLITGRGSIPTTLGLVTFATNVNLLNMPESGFDPCEIATSTKICGMRFIDEHTIRIAIAEYGLFPSSNILVFDLHINTNKIFVMSIYQKNKNLTHEFLSIDVLPSGEIIIAGRQNGVPFLTKWDVIALQTPVTYNSAVCGNLKSAFDFSLPILHKNGFIDYPASYNILQDDGTNILALVSCLGNEYGFIKFDPNTLSILELTTSLPTSQIPSIFEPGYTRAGFIGSGDNLLLQFVGNRKAICGKKLSYIREAIIRSIDSSFNLLGETSYSTILDSDLGDIRQAPGACLINNFNDFILRSETKNMVEVSNENQNISQNQVYFCLTNKNSVYTIELTNPGNLAAILYIS